MNGKENVCDRYIDEENCTYDPVLWAEAPSSDDRRRTTNGCESFHSHFNALFNSTHPNIFSFHQNTGYGCPNASQSLRAVKN